MHLQMLTIRIYIPPNGPNYNLGKLNAILM